MRNNKLFLFALVALLAFAATGCKKDSTDNLSFSNVPTFTIDEYIAHGARVTIWPVKIEKASGDTQEREIKLFYLLSMRGHYSDSVSQDLVQAQGLTISMPPGDSLGSTNFTLYATANGYNSSSSSKTINIIDPTFIGGSLTNMGINEDDPHMTDSDSTRYYTTEIAGKTWMKHNYAGGTVGQCYKGCIAMKMFFGKYYTWQEAQTICPSGWHLPSDEEWDAMEDSCGNAAGDYMVNALLLEDKIWPYWPDVLITNKTGFTALSAGYSFIKSDKNYAFIDFAKYAVFWTSGETGNLGNFRYINVQTKNIMRSAAGKTDVAASVRCIKD